MPLNMVLWHHVLSGFNQKVTLLLLCDVASLRRYDVFGYKCFAVTLICLLLQYADLAYENGKQYH
jgi:hypothetical protein